MSTEKEANAIPTIKAGVYRHTKSGKDYEVIGVALQTETEEFLVVYRPLYDNEYELFSRPYAMFIEEVEFDGKRVNRFDYIGTK